MNFTFDINANSVDPDQTGPSLVWSILFSTGDAIDDKLVILSSQSGNHISGHKFIINERRKQ